MQRRQPAFHSDPRAALQKERSQHQKRNPRRIKVRQCVLPAAFRICKSHMCRGPISWLRSGSGQLEEKRSFTHLKPISCDHQGIDEEEFPLKLGSNCFTSFILWDTATPLLVALRATMIDERRHICDDQDGQVHLIEIHCA